MKNKFYTAAGPETPSTLLCPTPGPVAPIDIVDLLDKCGEVLRREVQNLLMLTATGKKLDSACAKDLVAYMKLLQEIKDEQKAMLASKDTEELKELYK